MGTWCTAEDPPDVINASINQDQCMHKHLTVHLQIVYALNINIDQLWSFKIWLIIGATAETKYSLQKLHLSAECCSTAAATKKS